ncbi:hypothetical protein RYX36_032770 [Vicia faba]
MAIRWGEETITVETTAALNHPQHNSEIFPSQCISRREISMKTTISTQPCNESTKLLLKSLHREAPSNDDPARRAQPSRELTRSHIPTRSASLRFASPLQQRDANRDLTSPSIGQHRPTMNHRKSVDIHHHPSFVLVIAFLSASC